MKNICKKTKYLQTRVGDIQHSRTLYKENATRKLKYPLDEALKIDTNQCMSLKISQLTGALVLASPYREVEASLSKLSGISWSYEAIRKNAIQEGSWIGKREKEEQKQVKNLNYDMPEEKPETVYNKAGATYLRK